MEEDDGKVYMNGYAGKGQGTVKAKLGYERAASGSNRLALKANT